jgi:photosystem I subunit 10
LHQIEKYFTINILIVKSLIKDTDMNMELLLAAIPQTVTWSAKVASIMISANVFCILTGRYLIQVRGFGPVLSLGGSFENFTLPELLASASLGHVLGAGIILGLGYMGILL